MQYRSAIFYNSDELLLLSQDLLPCLEAYAQGQLTAESLVPQVILQ